MQATARDQALRRWERTTEWPLIAAAFLFLAAFAVPIIWPNLVHPLLDFTSEIMIGTWIAFAVDYSVRLILTTDRWHFFKDNVIDFLSIILPVLRPLRLLRVVAAMSVLARFGVRSLRGRVALYTVSFTLLVTFVAALSLTQAERGMPGATIQSFGDGLWLAFVTVTTVGYGDYTPITPTGRSVAVVLMMLGVLLLGAISATLASWLVERNLTVDTRDSDAAETEDELSALLTQIDTLNAQAAALHVTLDRHAKLLRGEAPPPEAAAVTPSRRRRRLIRGHRDDDGTGTAWNRS